LNMPVLLSPIQQELLQTLPITNNPPPAPSSSGSSAPSNAKPVKKQRSSAPEGNLGIVEPAIPVPVAIPVSEMPILHKDMGIAGRLKMLYEAKWIQIFAPAPLCRGFIFPGEHTFEEIRLLIQKMAMESGCTFWKTDTGATESSDGYKHSMTFRCPHHPDPAYYTEKKGRANEEDAHEPWRNESRQGQHVTGTKCGARFTINGKKSDVTEDKYIWRISPLQRAKLSMEHSGHPEPYANFLQKMVLTCAEKDSITQMVTTGMSSNQISAFLSNNGQKGAISKQTIGFISSSEVTKYDTELSTLQAKKPGESAAQALVDNLQALPKCTVVLLYKEMNSPDNKLTYLIAGKEDTFKVTQAEMEDVSNPQVA
jgi:hypothetical protein